MLMPIFLRFSGAHSTMNESPISIVMNGYLLPPLHRPLRDGIGTSFSTAYMYMNYLLLIGSARRARRRFAKHALAKTQILQNGRVLQIAYNNIKAINIPNSNALRFSLYCQAFLTSPSPIKYN